MLIVPEGVTGATNTCTHSSSTHKCLHSGVREADIAQLDAVPRLRVREESQTVQDFLFLFFYLRVFLAFCPFVRLHFPTLSPSLSFFLVSPWRAGMRGQIISERALHHYLLSDKQLGHSITLFLPVLHQWRKKKKQTWGQEEKI